MQVTPKNSDETTTTEIKGQMLERRPLPLGRQDFMDWSDRIISGTLVQADVESQRFALADLLLHLGPQESHKEDAFFIHSLRKFAINQVAVEMKNEIKAAHDKKVKEEQERVKESESSLDPSAELAKVVEACRLV